MQNKRRRKVRPAARGCSSSSRNSSCLKRKKKSGRKLRGRAKKSVCSVKEAEKALLKCKPALSSSSSSSSSPDNNNKNAAGLAAAAAAATKPAAPKILKPPIVVPVPDPPPPNAPPVPAWQVAALIEPFDFTTPYGAALSAAVTTNEVILRRVLHHLTLGQAIRLAGVSRAFRAARGVLCAAQRRAIVLVGNLASVAFLHYFRKEVELEDERTGRPMAVQYPFPADYEVHGLRLMALPPSSVHLTKVGLLRNLTELSIAESPVVLGFDSPLYQWLGDLRNTLVTFRLRLSNLNLLRLAVPAINGLRVLRHLTLLNINFDFDLLSERLLQRLKTLTLNIDQFSGDFQAWMEVLADREDNQVSEKENGEPPLKIHMSKFTGPLWINDWSYFVEVPPAAAACFTAIPVMTNIPLVPLERLCLTYSHITDLELCHPLGSLPEVIAALEPLSRLTFLTLQVVSPTVKYPNQAFYYGDGKYPKMRRLASLRSIKLAFNVRVHVDLTAWQLHTTFPRVKVAELMMVKFPCEECASRCLDNADCLRNGVRWAKKRWRHVPKLNFRIAYGFNTETNRYYEQEQPIDF